MRFTLDEHINYNEFERAPIEQVNIGDISAFSKKVCFCFDQFIYTHLFECAYANFKLL